MERFSRKYPRASIFSSPYTAAANTCSQDLQTLIIRKQNEKADDRMLADENVVEADKAERAAKRARRNEEDDD